MRVGEGVGGQAQAGLRLLAHCMRRADSRATCTAGSSKPTSTPMMAMTTSSSTSVTRAAWWCVVRW